MGKVLLKVDSATYLGGYEIEILFNNGTLKVVDLTNELDGKIFEPLKDKSYFANFFVSHNTIEWENGADFDPEFLYSIAKTAQSLKKAS